jgi:pyruvate/2-oxoglutarate dehydrogenase complex dihydrolipoamide acyltransferase (E2) component
MNFTVQAENEFRMVPVGQYIARLNKIDERPPTAAKPEWGPSLMWEFIVMDPGQNHGDSVACFTSTDPKTNNNLGKLLRGMLGRPLKAGEGINAGELIGKLFNISVDFNDSGNRTKVISATPHRNQAIPAESASTPASAPASAPVAPPPPPAAQKLAAALGSAPAAPSPIQKVYVQGRDCFKDPNRWVHYCGADGMSKEIRVLELKMGITNGKLAGSEIKVYLPDSAEWMPWAAVDLPF